MTPVAITIGILLIQVTMTLLIRRTNERRK
jgi:hypothetical protein